MKLTANITLDELTKSQVAERKCINNNPNPAQIENLKALAVNVLQPIRSHFDKPLIISSGFRCAQLCVEIGSSINSQHVADDFYRCVNCGADLEQKVNGVIKYIEANANTKIKLMEDFPPDHG